jgi:predicted DNA-binding transcriptional regulator YafY
MGQRSATETLAGIFQCFLERREWTQAAMAAALDVSVKALRARLEELQLQGIPLERVEAPPQVLWRVPEDWFPGSLQFRATELGELLRQLLQAPESDARNALIDRIVAAAPRKGSTVAVRETVDAPARSREEADTLPLVMQSAMERRCLLVRYDSTSRGGETWRNVSVQRVETGPPARFLAWCHESSDLRWFRVDNVRKGHLDTKTDFVEVDPAEVARCVAESLDGFRHQGAVSCAFTVRNPDARWVRRNLPGHARDRFVIDELGDDSVRITLHTSAVVPLARFVVGLGEAARAESPALRDAVAALARGALGGVSDREPGERL